MIADKVTKVLLAEIAAGVWVIVIQNTREGTHVRNTAYGIGAVASSLDSIERGVCRNNKLC